MLHTRIRNAQRCCGPFPLKIPIISGSFAESDVQLKACAPPRVPPYAYELFESERAINKVDVVLRDAALAIFGPERFWQQVLQCVAGVLQVFCRCVAGVLQCRVECCSHVWA